MFQTEVIQPLFDLADPNHPIHKEQLQTSASTNGSIGGLNNLNNVGKTPPPQIRTPNRTSSNANKSVVDGSNIGWVSQIDAASNSLLQITSQVVEATIASGNQVSSNSMECTEIIRLILIKFYCFLIFKFCFVI